MKSDFFSGPALRALNRLGDIVIPQSGDFPAFSAVGGLEHIDKIVSYAPKDDIGALNMVLTILGFMPSFVLKWFVNQITEAQEKEGDIYIAFRQLNLAVRGLVFSCYYSGRPGAKFQGKDPLEVIDFEIVRIED